MSAESPDPWDVADAQVEAILAEPVPLTYWLNPRHWPAEVSAWLYQHDWRTYCRQHDVCHWAWTHRACGCWRTTAEGRAWQADFEAAWKQFGWKKAKP